MKLNLTIEPKDQKQIIAEHIRRRFNLGDDIEITVNKESYRDNFDVSVVYDEVEEKAVQQPADKVADDKEEKPIDLTEMPF